jgi:hypothetical protein
MSPPANRDETAAPAVGGHGAVDKGYRPGTAALPFRAEFDYVRVWQP